MSRDDDLTREPTREEKTREAIAEGHDADIPSNIGFIPTPADEQRRASLTSHRRASHARERASLDPEKQGKENGSAKDEEEGSQTQSESDIVWWDGDKDRQNPYNFATWKKVLNCVLVSALTFVTPLASSMFAPGVPQLMVEFGSQSRELASFLFVIACAKAPSLSSFIAFRFLSGTFGSTPITNGGGTIADMIVQEKRGAAMASFSIGPLLGPIIGPVVGGAITDALGWRWVFWIIAIISGVLSSVFFFASEETYAPVILARKTKRLQKETGNDRLRSKLDAGLSPADYFKRGILRPFKMLFFSPICIICGVYVGLAYAYLYLLFTSLTPLFMQIYHFNTVHAGLTFLGLGVGSMIGVAYFSVSSDKYMKKKAAAAKEQGIDDPAESMRPENRLPPLRIGAVLLPAGFFIYGWTAEYHTHWIAPILGTCVIGVGNLVIFMSLQMYLIDSFTIYAASALAANAVMRSIAGAFLPLAGLPMYDKLGMGWGNSLLGFIAAALIPAPWLFIKYGEHLRKKFEIKDL
ncbi:multidrug resistant protein [Fusarium phyllophilum]|uniref:Multidrug resistant protein n=1 Tax=Fusarium phyllophilum TaxID=47803 RepID=A0A8H5K7X1_9HYPO|nr:multidrug resistant protein [Fusarium phyllophilum]